MLRSFSRAWRLVSRYPHAHIKRQDALTDSEATSLSITSNLGPESSSTFNDPTGSESSSPLPSHEGDHFSLSMVTSTITVHHQYTTATTFTEYTTQTAAASEVPASMESPPPPSGLNIHSRDGIIITVLACLAAILFVVCSGLLVWRWLRKIWGEETQHTRPHPVSFHQSIVSSERGSTQSRSTDSISTPNSKGRHSSRDDWSSRHTTSPIGIAGYSSPQGEMFDSRWPGRPSPISPISRRGSDITALSGQVPSDHPSVSQHAQAGSISLFSDQSSRTLAECQPLRSVNITEKLQIARGHHRLALSSLALEGTMGIRRTENGERGNAVRLVPPAYTPESPTTRKQDQLS